MDTNDQQPATPGDEQTSMASNEPSRPDQSATPQESEPTQASEREYSPRERPSEEYRRRPRTDHDDRGPRQSRREQTHHGSSRQWEPRESRGPRQERYSSEQSRSSLGHDYDTAPSYSNDRAGHRSATFERRRPDPRIPDDVTGRELDRPVWAQLRTLSKENAEGVAQHLVMVAALLAADDLEAALAHAETAVRRAGRVAAAREALGMVFYRKGEYLKALGEFRTVRRLSGSDHLLPLLVDCERGLGRYDKALDLALSPEAASLEAREQVELAIVVSGIRRDRNELDAALLALQIPLLKKPAQPTPNGYLHRLHYAYADTLEALGRDDEAIAWFHKAMEGDLDQETDAVERLEALEGIDFLVVDDPESSPDEQR